MKKFLKALPILVFFCMMCAVSGYAEKITTVYVQPAEDDETKICERAVTLYARNGTHYYLFLPTGMDCSELRILYTGDGTITIDGNELSSGDTTSCFGQILGETVDMVMNGSKTKLTVMQSSNIPSLYLTTESGNLTYIKEDKSNEETGTWAAMSAAGEITEQGELKQIRMHGNGTLQYNKKAYQIKLTDSTGLYGMDKGKTWILLANAKDYSLIRNKIAYDMALETGMTYAVQSTYVDLFINHEYQGNYLLCEKVEVGKNRVNITDLEKETEELNDQELDTYEKYGTRSYTEGTRKGYEIENDPEDITGGYLMEFELTYRYTNEYSGFVTTKGQPVVLKSPKYASANQVNYIADLMQELEEAIFTEDGINPTTGKHYYEYADKDSLVMMVLLEEVLKNYDANRSSLYFYKDSDSVSSLIYAGPGWDFDQSLDNYGTVGAAVWTAISSSTKFHWFPHLYKIPDFKERLCELYQEKFLPAMQTLIGENEEGEYLKSISTYQEEIAASAAMNFTRWGYTKV